MTIGEWLEGRTPPPPPALGDRLRSALGDALSRDVAETTDHCLAAAEALLAAVLGQGCTGRADAMDLLTADALVTYAFEAAGDMPGELDARAERAMKRIAALAAGSPS